MPLNEKREEGRGRSWQVIASELAMEKDPLQITKLAEELNRALLKQREETAPTRGLFKKSA
jgi:hypothetical protein